LVKGDVAQALGAINTAVDEGADPRQFARQMVEHLRALLLMRLESGIAPAHVSEDLRPRLQDQAAAFPPRGLARAVRLFNQAAAEAKGGWQPQLPLEMAFIEAALPPESADPESRPPSAQDTPPTPSPTHPAKSRPAPARSASPSPSPSSATVRESGSTYDKSAPGDGSLTPEILQSRWPKLLDALRPRNLSLEALMRSCEPVAVEGDLVSLGFTHNFHRSKVEEEHNKRIVEDVLSTLVGRRCRVRCVLIHQERAAAPPRRSTSKSTGGKAASSPEQVIAEDPVVRTAVEDLGAQIVAQHE
jgi:DNA polymerase-3 subunit gamma/tau